MHSNPPINSIRCVNFIVKYHNSEELVRQLLISKKYASIFIMQVLKLLPHLK